MQYVIDIILVALFALIVFLAAKKGFFKTLFELVAHIVALIGAKILSSALAPVVFEKFAEPAFRNHLETSLGEVGKKDYAGQAAATIDSIPSSLDGVLAMIGIDRAEISEAISSGKYAGKNLVENLMDNVVSPVVTAVLQTVLFIVLAILLTIILRLIIRFLDKIIKKLPALKQVNTSLGVLLGIIKGIIIVVVAALLIGALSGVVGNESFVELVNKSYIIGVSQKLLDSISGYTT